MTTWFGVVLQYFVMTEIAPVFHSFVGIRGKLRSLHRERRWRTLLSSEVGISVQFR